MLITDIINRVEIRPHIIERFPLCPAYLQIPFAQWLLSLGMFLPILAKTVDCNNSHAANIQNYFKWNNIIKEIIRVSAIFRISDSLLLMSAMFEKCSKQSGIPYSLSDILQEVDERSVVVNQHQVLSSTVKGIFSQKEYFNKDIASEDNKGYKVVRRGHVVLSPQNLWMGNINYNDRFDIGIVSPSYKVYSIRNGFNPTFIASLLRTKKALYEYMLASEQGASVVRRNLNVDTFLAIKFRIPDSRQQDLLSIAITAINAKLNNEQAILKQYTIQKSSLLDSMFI